MLRQSLRITRRCTRDSPLLSDRYICRTAAQNEPPYFFLLTSVREWDKIHLDFYISRRII